MITHLCSAVPSTSPTGLYWFLQSSSGPLDPSLEPDERNWSDANLGPVLANFWSQFQSLVTDWTNVTGGTSGLK